MKDMTIFKGLDAFDKDNFTLKNLAIIASAGTGKTYNICEMVKKLVDNGTDIKKILIVTYTEKAAEELKNRIRKKLPDADVDNATIGTIHSFCKQTLEEFCVASHKPSNLTLIDEKDATDFAKQYIRSNVLLTEIANIKSFASTNKISFEVEEQLIKIFVAVANNYYLNKSNVEVPEIISLVSVLDSNVAATFENIISNSTTTRFSLDVENALSVMSRSANSLLSALYEELKDNITLNFDGTKYQEKCFKSKGKPYTDDDKKAFELVRDTKDLIKSKLKSINSIIKYLACKHAKEFYKKWQEEKIKRSAQTYNDLIRNVREEVVCGGPLLDALKARYKVAIIDEFQDTNQKQWDIFKNIFLCKEHNIIVVLDPKQSIYAFQGSDLDVCINAVEEIRSSGGDVQSLDTNYRASSAIVESTGKFFSSPSALAPEMAFEASNCGKPFKFNYNGPLGNIDKPAYWIAKDLGDDESKEQSNFARIVCQTIIDCCTIDENKKTHLRVVREEPDNNFYEDNVSFKDFTVLARTRPEMYEIKKALEKSGIPHMLYKDNSVFNGIECADWISVLDAINTPNFSGSNRAKFKKALYTDFFGYSLSEINFSEFDKDNIEEIRIFDHWRTLARNGSWVDLISDIIIDTELANKLGGLNDLKKLGIFKQVGDYCIDYLTKTQSLDALLVNLKTLQDGTSGDEEGESDSNLTAINTDFDCVKIMTIHASKGLEFPVVISFGGFKAQIPHQFIDSFNYHDGGLRKLSFDDPGDCYSQEITEEWQRLFYVAYTRAKYVLILPNYQKVGAEFIKTSIEDYINKVGNPYLVLKDNGKNFNTLKSEAASILRANTISISDAVTEAEQKDINKDIIEHKPEHKTSKYAYCSLSHHKPKAEDTMTDDGVNESKEEDEAEEFGLAKYDDKRKPIGCSYSNIDPITFSADFPAGKGLGNAIHEVFEKIDYSGTIRTSQNDALIDSCFAKEGFGKTCKWQDDVYRIIESVLGAKLPEIHGSGETGNEFSLSELDFANRKNEIEFNFNKENEKLKHYFNGFIDLVFKRGEYYSILDWKSDKLKDDFESFSDGTNIKNHIDKIYSIQRVLYAYCLIKWLKNFYKDLSEQDIFEKHFGGVYYVCIRGCNEGTGNGIYAQTWNNFAELEAAYNKIVAERVGV